MDTQTPPSPVEVPPRSHGAAWALSLIAVPLLYLLSVPPVWNTLGIDRNPTPRWIELYNEPWLWLERNTPLAPVMEVYAGWWVAILRDR